MKIALVFLVLIGIIVLGLPFSISGDSSLTGRVRSFMSYSLTATALLLGMLTIFMSRSLSDELSKRQILTLMTKPLPRWQFIVGKWAGITIFNIFFLCFTGALVYGMVHYIKVAYPPSDDRYDVAQLEDEVLIARHALPWKTPDFDRGADILFERNLEEGKYELRLDFDPQAERALLKEKLTARWRVVPPLGARQFAFHNVLCDRSPGNHVQVRYYTRITRYPADEIYRSYWIFGNPEKGTPVVAIPTQHVVGRFHTISVPAECVAPDHTLSVEFHNENPFPGERQAPNIIEFLSKDEVEVLFVVGSFEGNLLRLLILMMCKLMFLAAVGILMASVFSFPVACLASFTIYVLAGTRSFIMESMDWTTRSSFFATESLEDFAVIAASHLYRVVTYIIPDFAYYDGVETFVSGHNVSLAWVLQGVGVLVFVQTFAVLGLAVLLFHRREVAEVSV